MGEQSIWQIEISAATKPAKTCAAGEVSNIELLMLVSDFVVNCRLKNTQWNFSGIHGMT